MRGAVRPEELYMRTSLRVVVAAIFCAGLLVATSVVAQESLLPTLIELRRQYPTPMSPTHLGEFLTRAAQSQHGWVLLRKNTGNRCPTPMGVDASCDYLVYAPTGQGFDVLENIEGPAIPRWNKGDSFNSDLYLAPPLTVPGPPPTPPTPPDQNPSPQPASGNDLDALLALLAEHDTQMRTAIEMLRMQLDAHTQKLESLAADHSRQPSDPERDPNVPLDEKGFTRRWLVERILPMVLAAIGGWGATR